MDDKENNYIVVGYNERGYEWIEKWQEWFPIGSICTRHFSGSRHYYKRDGLTADDSHLKVIKAKDLQIHELDMYQMLYPSVDWRKVWEEYQ